MGHGTRDLASETLFSQVMQDARQLFLVHALQKVGCCLALRPVHAHVQGTGSAEGKTALRLIELNR